MPGNGNSGGHNAKTVSRLQASGTFRDDRHSGFKNMKHVPGRPETPKDLSGDALDEWNRMISRMELTGSLSKIDDAVVYQYAKLYAETITAERHSAKLEKNVDKLIAASNRLHDADLVEAMRQITGLEKLIAQYSGTVRMGRMAIRQYLVELGMTSSARGRVKMPGGDGEEKQGGKLMSFRGGKE